MIYIFVYHAILYMKKLKILIAIVILILIVLLLFKTVPITMEDSNKKRNFDNIIIANASTSFQRSGDIANLDIFLDKLEENQINMETSEYYNVTPSFINENSTYQIFKDANTGNTYLLYEEDIYKLGNSRDGDGVISFALADFNQDGMKELYFSYTWDTGVYRTNIAYFDAKDKKIKGFDNIYFKDKEVILLKIDDMLCAVEAEYTEHIDKVNFKLSSRNILARITFENDEIILKEESKFEK